MKTFMPPEDVAYLTAKMTKAADGSYDYEHFVKLLSGQIAGDIPIITPSKKQENKTPATQGQGAGAAQPGLVLEVQDSAATKPKVEKPTLAAESTASTPMGRMLAQKAAAEKGPSESEAEAEAKAKADAAAAATAEAKSKQEVAAAAAAKKLKEEKEAAAAAKKLEEERTAAAATAARKKREGERTAAARTGPSAVVLLTPCSRRWARGMPRSSAVSASSRRPGWGRWRTCCPGRCTARAGGP